MYMCSACLPSCVCVCVCVWVRARACRFILCDRMFLLAHGFGRLSVCLSIYLFVCIWTPLSVHCRLSVPSACLPFLPAFPACLSCQTFHHLSLCASVWPSVFVCSSARLSVSLLAILPPVCPFVCLSVCLSVCLCFCMLCSCFPSAVPTLRPASECVAVCDVPRQTYKRPSFYLPKLRMKEDATQYSLIASVY